MVERPVRHHLAQASHPDLICLCQQPYPWDQAHIQQQGRIWGYKRGAMNMGGGHEPGGVPTNMGAMNVGVEAAWASPSCLASPSAPSQKDGTDRRGHAFQAPS